MVGPMSAQIKARPGALARRFLAAMGFVAFGAFALFDASSTFVSRLAGILIALSAGAFAWIYAREAVRPGTVLTLDRDGLHLRRRDGGDDLDAPWHRLLSVDVTSDPQNPVVELRLADPILDVEERPRYATTASVLLPQFIGVPAEDIVAEIERFRRAYAFTHSQDREP